MIASAGTILADGVNIGNLYYNLDDTDKTAAVTCQYYFNYRNYYNLTTITIPSSVTFNSITYTVTSIESGAFYSSSNLTSVTIPNSIISVGEAAFEGCTNLRNPVYNEHVFAYLPISYTGAFIIPDGIEHIAPHAFCDCSSLTSVTIPNSVTNIGEFAFYNCTNLTSVTVGNGVVSIGVDAFYDCSGLTGVHIGDLAAWNSITFGGAKSNPLYYAHHLYLNGTEIIDLMIPDSVTQIGNYTFSGCTDLASVTIPNSVISIGKYAFSNCQTLTSVTIPNSVTNIGEFAFSYCSGLTSLTCEAVAPPTCGFSTCVFNGVNKYIPLYVPAESVNAYKTAIEWRDFKNIQPIPIQDEDTITVVPTETTISFSWPQVDNADTYELTIHEDTDNLVCELIFDAEGQLISSTPAMFAKGNAPKKKQQLIFSYTYTNLRSGTTYSYTLIAKDRNGAVIQVESGSFSTLGTATAIEYPLTDSHGVKCLREGKIYILRGEKVFSITGQKVR